MSKAFVKEDSNFDDDDLESGGSSYSSRLKKLHYAYWL
ncbi:hypothetical protein OURE66S_02954 [Oligella ureolytica]